MKREQNFFVISLLLLISPNLTAQTARPARSDVTLQEIVIKLDQLDKKFDQLDKKVDEQFKEIDKRLYEIEKTLAIYDERFQAMMKIFTIFGSVFGFVILIAVAIFGYYFNRLGQLIKQISTLETKYEVKKYRFEDELITEDLINKIKALIREQMPEPSKISDEIAEYKTKPD